MAIKTLIVSFLLIVYPHFYGMQQYYFFFQTLGDSPDVKQFLKSKVSGLHIEGAHSLKSDSHLPKKIVFVCFNESPLKVMKYAFYFILKALFILKVFRFLSWYFGHVEETT